MTTIEPATVTDVVQAISWLQPSWVDGGFTYDRGKAIADAFRERINSGAQMPDHHVHTLWMLERGLEWSEHDCMVESDCEPPAYEPPDECQWCKTAPLWDRATVDRLKSTKLIIAAGDAVVFEVNASPADSLQAGIELGFPHFRRLWGGYPVYSKYERKV